jgi:hypothetical protein
MKTLINSTGPHELLRVSIFILAEKKLLKDVQSYRAVCFKVGKEKLIEPYLRFGFFKNKFQKQLNYEFTSEAIKMFKIII